MPQRGTRGRPTKSSGVYLWRRMLVVFAASLGVLALVLVAFGGAAGARDEALPIDPNAAGPDVALSRVAGVYVSSPIRPEDLTVLGYHPEGESVIEMSPRGKNLSRNPLLNHLSDGSTPEKIQYHMMDPADREGPHTGALDVGAEAGAQVYAPVTGTVTAIRPDPVLREDANVVEIKPAENPDVRVFVSLVQEIDDEIGPRSSVTAGLTGLGSVADSAGVLRPQLSDYTRNGTGNHVTVSASGAN